MKNSLIDLLRLAPSLRVENGELSYRGGRISLSVPGRGKVRVSEKAAEMLLRRANRFIW